MSKDSKKTNFFTESQVVSALADSISGTEESDLRKLKVLVDNEIAKRTEEKELEKHRKLLIASDYLYENINLLESWFPEHSDNCYKKKLSLHDITDYPSDFCQKCILEFVKNSKYNEYFYLKGFLFDVVDDKAIGKYGDDAKSLKKYYS